MRRLMMLVLALAVLSQAGVAETLDSWLTRYVINEYRLDSNYVRITLIRSDLTATDVSGLDIHAYPLTQSDPRGRFPLRVELFRDGEMVDKGSVSLDVRIFTDLLVPRQNIRRHEMLSADMFKYKRFDITSITEKMLTDISQLEACRAKQNLSAGRYVPVKRVEKLPDVENGQSVTIIGSGALFEIRARGKALQSGVVGERVKVKNVDSRKILVGKITAPGVVEIAI